MSVNGLSKLTLAKLFFCSFAHELHLTATSPADQQKSKGVGPYFFFFFFFEKTKTKPKQTNQQKNDAE